MDNNVEILLTNKVLFVILFTDIKRTINEGCKNGH